MKISNENQKLSVRKSIVSGFSVERNNQGRTIIITQGRTIIITQ